MRLIYGDLFCPETYKDEEDRPLSVKPDAIVITVNGFVKRDGLSVMGRGCAKQAADRWPWLASAWGKLAKQGAGVSVIGEVSSENLRNVDVIAFPVKSKTEVCEENKANVVNHMRGTFKPGDVVPGWACKARVDIIRKSVNELEKLVEAYGYKNVVLVRPGIGAGELQWESQVRPILMDLSDTFLVISNA